MLTLDAARTEYNSQDEAQIIVKPKNFDTGITHTFQLISKEVSMYYMVQTKLEPAEYIKIPMIIPNHPDYNSRALCKKWMFEGADPKKAMFEVVELAVWSYKHDAQKVLSLTGAGIRKVLNMLPSGEDALKVKLQITKTTIGTNSSYNYDIKKDDRGLPELSPIVEMEKEICLTNNIFPNTSVYDDPIELAEILQYIKL